MNRENASISLLLIIFYQIASPSVMTFTLPHSKS
jgi:hypothetical protein